MKRFKSYRSQRLSLECKPRKENMHNPRKTPLFVRLALRCVAMILEGVLHIASWDLALIIIGRGAISQQRDR